MFIRELEVKELHKTAEWLYNMNEQDQHFVAWLASDPNEIFEQIWTLTQFDDPLAYVAWEGEEIIGFLGLLPFFEQKLCRLLGPFASKDEQEVIDQLWNKASLTVQLHFEAAKVACFESNKDLLSFTRRHDFKLYNIEKTLAVYPPTYSSSGKIESSIIDVTQEDYEGLAHLHPVAAYYTTEEMMRLSNKEGNYLWGYQKDGRLIGYLYFETITSDLEGEICFVNVGAGERGEGVGSTLIEHALDYAFHALNLSVVTISVRTENSQAEELYRTFGFKEMNTIHAYEKIIKKQPPLVH